MEKFTLAVVRKLEKRNSIETERHGIDCEFLWDLGEEDLLKDDYFGLNKYRIEILRNGFLIHDVGKSKIIGIDYIKRIERGSEEWKELRNHSIYGSDLLNECVSELSKDWPGETGRADMEIDDLRSIILEHHEHYDGSGYPYGLKGENISIYGRIAGFVESSEAMLHNRRYKGDKIISNVEQYLDEIRKCSGKQFDPRIVDIFLKIVDDKERLELLKNFSRVNKCMEVI